jgi:hypothetical protein
MSYKNLRSARSVFNEIGLCYKDYGKMEEDWIILQRLIDFDGN